MPFQRGFASLERDDFSSNRHPALSFCLSMISGQTLRVCPEGKPVPTFPDHAPSVFQRKRPPDLDSGVATGSRQASASNRASLKLRFDSIETERLRAVAG